MKSTGIIRKLDELGRVVIPIELRNKFNISERGIYRTMQKKPENISGRRQKPEKKKNQKKRKKKKKKKIKKKKKGTFFLCGTNQLNFI